MAGQAQRGSRGHGRSSRPASSPAPVAAVSAPGRGVGQASLTTTTTELTGPSVPATRAVYRLLLMKGLAPAEASSLTAFICGLPTTDLNWSLKQVNELLFLRRMRQLGRFGSGDGGVKRPH